ncbi:MAG: aspartate/glutamate racemase family protein [Gemmatimonadota bacterium]
MKTLGLMGGMSWVSTIEYYRLINEGVNKRLGGNHAARLAMFSVNFGDIAEIVAKADWDRFLEMAAQACKGLQAAGAEAIILCANTAHIVADRLKPRLDVPLIHLVDATAEEIRRAGLDRVSLLGTRFTMEAEFFRDRLKKYGITAVTPGQADRDWIHATIFNELGKNIFLPATKQRYLDIIGGLSNSGAQGAILGCTEIPLIIKPGDLAAPSFDTTAIHAEAAVNFSLG